jgi:hypothetical protein
MARGRDPAERRQRGFVRAAVKRVLPRLRLHRHPPRTWAYSASDRHIDTGYAADAFGGLAGAVHSHLT